MAAVTIASCHVSSSTSLSKTKTKWQLSQLTRATCRHPLRFLKQKQNGGRHNCILPRVGIHFALQNKNKMRPSQLPHATCLHPLHFLKQKQSGGPHNCSLQQKQNGGHHCGVMQHVCTILDSATKTEWRPS